MTLTEKPVYTSTHSINLSETDICALKHCYDLFDDLLQNSFELTLNDKYRAVAFGAEDWQLVRNRIDIILSIVQENNDK